MRLPLALMALLACCAAACAQDRGSLSPRPLPALAHPEDPSTPAKELFGRKENPSHQRPQVIGFYAKGCLAGASQVPYDGDAWQVMRISRNRNYGHPALVAFLERTARSLREHRIWPGFLIGDMAQPRGGPMRTGHASHQIGLDADIWMTPMPNRTLTREEREEMSATNVVRHDKLDIDPQSWTAAHLAMLRFVARQPEVQRIFVNAAIKKALCREATGDRGWLAKMRPMWGHNYHFHIRLACPPGEASCQHQAPVPESDGCDSTLAWWFKPQVLHPRPNPHAKPKPPMTMAALPYACRAVLESQ
jgi:penicillin-insensitive murein endopeptidase